MPPRLTRLRLILLQLLRVELSMRVLDLYLEAGWTAELETLAQEVGIAAIPSPSTGLSTRPAEPSVGRTVDGAETPVPSFTDGVRRSERIE